MDLVFAPSEIETWPIERLHTYANNAKMHGPDQVAKIAASMAKSGWTVPCMVADDGALIGPRPCSVCGTSGTDGGAGDPAWCCNVSSIG